MGAYLVAKKWFILDHTELPQAHRDKIEALYLSPADIGKLVADLESENTDEQAELIDDGKAIYESEAETHGKSVPGNSYLSPHEIPTHATISIVRITFRSEERRVGKESVRT